MIFDRDHDVFLVFPRTMREATNMQKNGNNAKKKADFEMATQAWASEKKTALSNRDF